MPETPVTKDTLLARLQHGQANGKNVRTLAFEVGTTERGIRRLVDDLIADGVPVCALPATGYYIAATEAEVEANCEFLRDRAVHSFARIKRLRDAWNRMAGIDDEPLPAL